MKSPRERFKMIASGYVILRRGAKILLLRRAHTGYEDGKYSLPAGHVEDRESIRSSAVREAKEEIGVVINPSDLIFVHAMHRRQNDIRVDFFFTTTKWFGEPHNAEPSKCDDVSWFPLDILPDNTIAYIRYALEQYRSHVPYSEQGWVGL